MNQLLSSSLELLLNACMHAQSICSVSHNSEKDMQTARDHEVAFEEDKEGRALFEEASACDRFSAGCRGCH